MLESVESDHDELNADRPEGVAASLRRVFGYDRFRAHQREVIETLIAGQDALVLMPTGGGKSLCYQLASLHRPGVGVIVSPLISLMKDQVDALRQNGVRARYCNSSLDWMEMRDVLDQLRVGALDLLYVTPERVVTPQFISRLAETQVALFAIDEAHCVSQWGHNFRPEYTQLSVLRQAFPEVPMVALTATADPPTREDILAYLGLKTPRVVMTSFDRPEIRYDVVHKHQPVQQILRFLKEEGEGSGIIYALSRRAVEAVAEKLRAEGYAAAAYHAGLPSEERSRVHEAFVRDEIAIVVATVAFGMGIDKPNVRFVVHHDLAKTIESYYQETGRAGRDGLPARALLLYGAQDIFTARSLIERNENEDQRRVELHKLGAMIAYAEALTCRRKVLLGTFGEQMTEDCGNCDVCLDPPETYDGTQDAQKALSCVFRLDQRFGMRHAIDVLRGGKTARIARLGHDQLSTYGIGASESVVHWEAVFRQLIHNGLMFQDVANYSVLRLTSAARPVLRGEAEITLAKPRLQRKAKRAKGRKRRSSGPVFDDYDEALFETLRGLRATLAKDAGVPAFVVFGDKTLMHMAQAHPASPEALLEIHGVGEAKLEKYGEAFLDAISAYQPDS